MAVKFISDTHFNHRNIIEYTTRTQYFAPRDIEAMEAEIIKRWNKVVGPEDIVYHLGDFAFGSKEIIKNLVSRLNGRIRLILGNHDKRKKPQWYDGLGFDRVYDRPIIYKDWFILSHEPIKYITPASPMVNIHGHTHDEEYANPQRVNVCWEVVDGYPITFDEIKSRFSELDEFGAAAELFVKDRHRNAAMNYNEGYAQGYIDGKKGNVKSLL